MMFRRDCRERIVEIVQKDNFIVCNFCDWSIFDGEYHETQLKVDCHRVRCEKKPDDYNYKPRPNQNKNIHLRN